MNPDVLIVGAGPAGMSAALAINAAGAVVRVVEEQPAAGGQVYRAIDRISRKHPENLKLYGSDYARGLSISRQFREANIEVSYSARVWDICFENNRPAVGLLEGDQASYCYPRHIVLATGAMERPTPFPGWTLPGVMTVGAAQTLFKESALLPESSSVIAGTGPLVYLFVKQMIAAGRKPKLILDTGPRSVSLSNCGKLFRASITNMNALYKGWSWLQEIKQAGIERLTGVTSITARGGERLQSVEYRRGNRSFEIDTDLLLVHDGVIPNSHLAMAAGCEHRWNSFQRYWSPLLDRQGLSSQPAISICGDSAGIAGVDAATCSGAVTGWNVAKLLSFIDQVRCQSETSQNRQSITRISTLRRFIDSHYLPFEYFQIPPDDDTVVCRCEQISVGDIRQVATIGCMGPNQAKAFTRCGMGPCMGRQCGNTVSQLFAKFHDRSVAEIGYYRIRPPLKPLTLKQLSNLDLTQ